MRGSAARGGWERLARRHETEGQAEAVGESDRARSRPGEGRCPRRWYRHREALYRRQAGRAPTAGISTSVWSKSGKASRPRRTRQPQRHQECVRGRPGGRRVVEGPPPICAPRSSTTRENLSARRSEFADRLLRPHRREPKAQPEAEVEASIARLFTCAAWADLSTTGGAQAGALRGRGPHHVTNPWCVDRRLRPPRRGSASRPRPLVGPCGSRWATRLRPSSASEPFPLAAHRSFYLVVEDLPTCPPAF